MSPEKQREAIAKAVGEFDPPKCKPSIEQLEAILADKKHRIVHLMPDGQVRSIPDYLNSLDAINAAERYTKEHLMNLEQWEQYGRELEKTHPSACLLLSGSRTDASSPVDYYDFATLMVELTAAQRLECLVKALGLWTDED